MKLLSDLKLYFNSTIDAELQYVFLIIGLIYYRCDLLLWSLLFSWLINNFVYPIMHEGWAHGFFKPKNKIIGYFFNFICIIFMSPVFAWKIGVYSPHVYWMGLHRHHHVYWKTPRDHIQFDLDTNGWVKYLFLSHRPQYPNLYHDQITEREIRDVYSRLDPVSLYLEKNYVWISKVFHAIFLILVGFKLWFYFVFIPIIFFYVMAIVFTEILPHVNNPTKEDDRDQIWSWPICVTNAYHVTHHWKNMTIVFGPGRWKYLNIQYYFFKLFYDIHPKVKII
jgi:hypothetical protein